MQQRSRNTHQGLVRVRIWLRCKKDILSCRVLDALGSGRKSLARHFGRRSWERLLHVSQRIQWFSFKPSKIQKVGDARGKNGLFCKCR